MAESERKEGVLQLGEIRQAVSALSIADTANHGQSVLTLRKGSNEEPCACERQHGSVRGLVTIDDAQRNCLRSRGSRVR